MSTAVTEQTWDQEVMKSDKPVIVDFWAEWCGPCHAVAPVLDRIAGERESELKLVKVNIDEEQGLAQRYGIVSIPTIVLFKEGEPAAAAVGAQPKSALERSLGLASRDEKLGGLLGLEVGEVGRVLREVRLDVRDAGACPILEPGLRQVFLDLVDAAVVHPPIIGTAPDDRHGPIGSSFGLADL